ncbi:MAG: 1-acyl-sn-glycerol-3-phosphate acyltransferase [Rhodospirillales bacterium]|jgi:1-acyl-sn-glycerol-3-phosphate acyltransferase|nr:1-acyl-sn-glycerol-3-phosphate acyltransferase [Rhodospirillales bacterium]MBT4625286.1 1-acyl-sn-glycerol-3-phosphate acyltransferase [Rhodospirillales bacterium]MBT5352559.1 1-acyl-sn-glycerol-3-phosphate acyltransferase [Rhodospirillales bacterium]MBT5520802.1 1-acyl-sn-glycerol-3-phosphate acyltransferase [Rhodospirillales bacterium]MBT6111920.1 1-acyl-sn-glycerol-3-phosphate acyltransferase [Rhodospirillales bacterium]
MMRIRSFIFDILQIIVTLITMLSIIVMLVLPWQMSMKAIVIWIRVSLFLSRWILGIHMRVIGTENIPDGPVVIASKHQSAWETAVFPMIVPGTVYVMKKELLSIPIWGWCARKVRSIAVDRAGGASALKQMLSDTKARLAEGRRVVIFPEGTRMPSGESGSYHPGIAAIYTSAKVPVVPVALNSGLFWGRRSVGMKTPGTITVQFLPAIQPGMDRKEFMGTLKSRIDAATEQLEADARQFPR